MINMIDGLLIIILLVFLNGYQFYKYAELHDDFCELSEDYSDLYDELKEKDEKYE